MEYEECEGCGEEKRSCYCWQKQPGFCSGLDWREGHCFHFVVEEKTGELVIF